MNTRRALLRLLTGLLTVAVSTAVVVFVGPPVMGVKERVTFRSGDISLSGRFVRPAGDAPHPAIVLLHGSGGGQTHDKWYYRFHANALVRRGFAVLSFDKRGCGESTGNVRTATFQDLVDDGVAAVAFLRSRPDVMPGKIGLLGVSESGWFTPEIAAKAGKVAFIINRVSSPLSWRDTVLFEIEHSLREQGVSSNDVEAVLRFSSLLWQHQIEVSTGQVEANGPEREAVEASRAELRRRPGLEDVLGESTPVYTPEELAARASRLSYDPLPFLTELEPPALYILAGKDVNVPTDRSMTVIRRLRSEFGRSVEVRVYPEAGHYLYRWTLVPFEGLYVAGYLDYLASWAADQIQTAPALPGGR